MGQFGMIRFEIRGEMNPWRPGGRSGDFHNRIPLRTYNYIVKFYCFFIK